MEEIEYPPIKITLDDVEEANKLSLACPICSSPVYRTYDTPDMMPVECVSCGAIYHKACWEMGGGVCAMVGCEETKYKPYGLVTRNGSSAKTVQLNEKDIRINVSDSQRIKYQERASNSSDGPIIIRFFSWLWRRIVQ